MKNRGIQAIILIGLITVLMLSFILISNGQIFTRLTRNQAAPIRTYDYTDPGNPDPLTVGTPLTGQSYSTETSYYYYAPSANPARYHVIWLRPAAGNDDFNLYVFSNSGYSNLLASSLRGVGLTDWVVFRPTNTQPIYVNVTALDNGNGVIEWEDSSVVLTAGAPQSLVLDENNAIEVYQVNLIASSTYTFTLEVPVATDYDLFLYYLNSGSAANPNGFISKSDGGGNGEDETISDFSPLTDGKFVVLVVWNSGAGSFTLTLSEISGTSDGSPSDNLDLWLYPVIELPIFFGATFGLVGLIYLRKYIQSRRQSEEAP